MARALSPFPQQIPIVQALTRSIEQGSSGLCVCPTGTGKTNMAGEALSNARLARRGSSKPFRALILAPKDEICDQFEDRFKAIAADRGDPPMRITRYNANKKDLTGDVVLATYGTIRSIGRDLPEFDMILVDEAHHAPAEQLSDFLGLQSATKIGVTATPETTDGRDAAEPFDGRIIATMTKSQALGRDGSPPLILPLQIKSAFDQEELLAAGAAMLAENMDEGNRAFARLLDTPAARASLGRNIQAQGDTRFTLVYASSVDHARSLSGYLNNTLGIPAAYVDKDVTGKDRSALYDSFSQGKTHVLLSYLTMTEALDLPSAKNAHIMRGDTGPHVLEQIMGRIRRRAPGKTHGTIHDYGLSLKTYMGSTYARDADYAAEDELADRDGFKRKMDRVSKNTAALQSLSKGVVKSSLESAATRSLDAKEAAGTLDDLAIKLQQEYERHRARERAALERLAKASAEAAKPPTFDLGNFRVSVGTAGLIVRAVVEGAGPMGGLQKRQIAGLYPLVQGDDGRLTVDLKASKIRVTKSVREANSQAEDWRAASSRLPDADPATAQAEYRDRGLTIPASLKGDGQAARAAIALAAAHDAIRVTLGESPLQETATLDREEPARLAAARTAAITVIARAKSVKGAASFDVPKTPNEIAFEGDPLVRRARDLAHAACTWGSSASALTCLNRVMGRLDRQKGPYEGLLTIGDTTAIATTDYLIVERNLEPEKPKDLAVHRTVLIDARSTQPFPVSATTSLGSRLDAILDEKCPPNGTNHSAAPVPPASAMEACRTAGLVQPEQEVAPRQAATLYRLARSADAIAATLGRPPLQDAYDQLPPTEALSRTIRRAFQWGGAIPSAHTQATIPEAQTAATAMEANGPNMHAGFATLPEVDTAKQLAMQMANEGPMDTQRLRALHEDAFRSEGLVHRARSGHPPIASAQTQAHPQAAARSTGEAKQARLALLMPDRPNGATAATTASPNSTEPATLMVTMAPGSLKDFRTKMDAVILRGRFKGSSNALKFCRAKLDDITRHDVTRVPTRFTAKQFEWLTHIAAQHGMRLPAPSDQPSSALSRAWPLQTRRQSRAY